MHQDQRSLSPPVCIKGNWMISSHKLIKFHPNSTLIFALYFGPTAPVSHFLLEAFHFHLVFVSDDFIPLCPSANIGF